MARVQAGTKRPRKAVPAEEAVQLAPRRPRPKRGLQDIFRVANDEAYAAQLRAEAEWWDGRPETLSSIALPPELQRYENQRLTGDPAKPWFEAISDYGDFKRGCALGAGPGAVESYLLARHPELRLAIYDISRDSLQRLQVHLDAEAPGRAEVREEDLNFADLPAGKFDLVVSQSSMHHIVNLEHLAFQVNRCLTPDGLFFMRDAVCESYFQFSEEKRQLLEAYVEARHGSSREVHWPDRGDWQFSPFESVRSEEILDVFGRYLDEVSVRTSGALLMPMLFTNRVAEPSRPAAPAGGIMRRLRNAARRRLVRLVAPNGRPRPIRAMTDPFLLMVDAILCDTGYLRPGLAFAIYRKRTP